MYPAPKSYLYGADNEKEVIIFLVKKIKIMSLFETFKCQNFKIYFKASLVT